MISLGRGHVFHSRREGAENSFNYPTFFVHFRCDLEPELQNTLKRKFKNLLSLNAQDFLVAKPGGFNKNIKEFLKEQCQYEADQVWLQTLPRMLGFVFNPVTFWLCRRGTQLEAVLVEVCNTFGEKHFYWVQPTGGVSKSEWYRAEKVFHVSPFFPVDGYYEFRFQVDEKNSRIDINYFSAEKQLRLATWVSGELSALESHSLVSVFGRYGWMTPLVILRIHYQAFKLFLRKSKFYPKPQLPEKKVS